MLGGRKGRGVLFLLFAMFFSFVTGCSKDATGLVSKPKDIKNTFILFEEEYVDDDGRSIGNLYMKSEDGEKKKISGNVVDSNVEFINDKNMVLFLNDENSLYKYTASKGKGKLATDVVSFTGDYEDDIVTYQNEDGDLYIIQGDEEDEKIASTVTQFELLDNKLYYINDEEDFYMYDIKNNQEQEIASDVSFFKLLDNKKMIYLNDDFALYYLKSLDDESIKITNNAVSPYNIKKISRDEILYLETEDDEESANLYKASLKENSTNEKIASDIQNYIYEDGTIYYMNSDGNLYKKKENDEAANKLASDVVDFKLYNDTIYYKDVDNQLYKLANKKEKLSSDVLEYTTTDKGDVVYSTEDQELFLNNKKIASEIDQFSYYYGNLAYATKNDELFLMKDMGEKQLISDELNKFSKVYYQNTLIFNNELTFEDIAGVWRTNDEDALFLQIEKNGKVTYLNNDYKEDYEVDYADTRTIHAVSDSDSYITFELDGDGQLMVTDEEGEYYLTKSNKKSAIEYEKNKLLQADNESIRYLMDQYLSNFAYAVNYGDSSYIADYMDSGSAFYKQQVNFVQDSYEKSVNEELIKYDIKDIKPINDNEYQVFASEHFTVQTGDKVKQAIYDSVYTVKRFDGEFLITGMKIS